MPLDDSTDANSRLERSCALSTAQVRRRLPGAGIELMQAVFKGRAYSPHRHDSYAIGITQHGVQQFDYRGETRNATPGTEIGRAHV